MTTQQPANLYTQGYGSRPENVEIPVIKGHAPASTDVNYPLGKRWIDSVSDNEYTLTSFSTSEGVISANWAVLSAAGTLTSLETDDSVQVSPSSGIINIAGASPISTTGSGNTATINLSGTVDVAHGGTGDTSFTAYAPICGGTSTTGALQVASTGLGTSGFVLTSNGSSALPSWKSITAENAITTVDGDSGSMTPTAGVVTVSGGTTGLTTSASSSTMDLTGTLVVANGGTGAATLTGLLTGNGTSAVSATAITQYNVLTGGASNAPNSVAPSATSGVPVISQGAAAQPIFGTAVVAGGGTGATTLTGVLTGNGTSAVTANAITQHGVLIAGASNAVANLAVAATGTVLAGSTGADPAFTGSPSVSGSVTAGTTLTATLGDITATNGNLVLGTAGNKLRITTGSNASIGTSAAMTAGSITISTTAVTASSIIFLTHATTAGTLGNLYVGTITAGTSFVINSSSNTDTSTVNWLIIN